MLLPESPRLVFRSWAGEDLPLAESLWRDADVMRHMGGPMTEEDVRTRLETEILRQHELGVQYWPMFLRDAIPPHESGEFAGCAGLRPWHDEPNVFELGVHLARSSWSRRLGEEAALAVIRFAFETLHLHGLTAGHGPENANSKALIERLGFHYTHSEPWGRRNTMHPYYRLKQAEAKQQGQGT